jgi:DUF4097 and DUF4098 domain-containing protein YvlB
MYRRIALAALVLLVGGMAARAEEWTRSYPVKGPAELRVDAKDGSVTVHAWSQTSVSARVTVAGWKIGPGEVEVIDHQTGDRVELEVRVPRNHFGIMARRPIRIEINVPRNTRVDVHTGDGSIKVYDIAGEVRMQSGDGGLEAEGVSGTVTARTGDGGVHIEGKLEALTLHTGDGGVEVTALPGSRVTTSWRIETGDGGVTLRLPADLSADLDVHTGDGSLSVDLPVQTSHKDNNSLIGRLGRGGALVTIRTGDGSVRLARN